jgi:hypothetical protein
MADGKRIKCKVINLERQGEDIFFGINGKNFQVQDRKVVYLDQGMIDVIKNCVITRRRHMNDPTEMGTAVETYEDPRFEVVILDGSDEEVTPSNDLATELQEEAIGATVTAT